MELLSTHKSHQPKRWTEIVNNSASIIRNAARQQGIAPDIAEAVINRATEYSRLRFGLTDDETAYNTAAETVERIIDRQAVKTLSDVWYYDWRDYITSALRWPNFYMDVVPIPKHNYAQLLRLICNRNKLYGGNAWPTIFPRCVLPKTFFSKSTPLVEDYIEAEKMVRQLTNSTYPAWRQIIGSKMSRANGILFRFDGNPVVEDAEQQTDGLHFNTILRIMGWSRWARNGWQKPAKLLAVEYKIFAWCAYDILHELIIAGYGGTIIINDPLLSRVSYFFVRLGENLCGRHLRFEFIEPISNSQPGYQIHNLENLTAAQAVYFGHWHEFYASNIDPSPGFAKDVYVAPMQFYQDYLQAQKAVQEYAKSLVSPHTHQEYEVEVAKIREEISNYPSVDFPEAVLVSAPPGTGKSTYVNKLVGYYPIEYDRIKYSLRIGGKTIYDINNEVKEKAAEEFKNFPPNAAKIFASSVFHGCRRDISRPYNALADKVKLAVIDMTIAAKINVVIEDIAKYTSRLDSSIIFADACDDISVAASIAPLSFSRVRAVYIYANIAIQYNQQANRAIKEERFIRYEILKRFNKFIWGPIQDEWLTKTEVYFVDGAVMIPIVVNRRMMRNNLYEYRKKYIVDTRVLDFINQFGRGIPL